MPVTTTYPGVYIEELPSGVRTITGVATSITVFVGWAPKGPTDRAQRVLSWQDYERWYGGLDARSYLGYAVRSFFSNGGADAYVMRLAHTDAVAGTRTSGDNILRFTAKNPGAWGSTYGVRLLQRADDATRFRILVDVLDGSGNVLSTPEAHENLSLVLTDPREVATVVTAASSIVRVEVIGSRASPPAQITTSQRLAGGNDGTVLAPGPDDAAGNFQNALNAVTATDAALDRIDLFNLLCVPGETRPATLQSLQAFCRRRRAFLIADCARGATVSSLQGGPDTQLTGNDAINAAFYFPWVMSPDPLRENRPRPFPPSGLLAGVYARTDAARGVWKAPAGIDASLTGAMGIADPTKDEFVEPLTDAENGTLNPKAVNCIRTFPVYGTVAWGARTLQGNDERGSEWKYVPVRRIALFIEESLYRGTKWVVFEPNDEPLWAQIRLNIGAFMHSLFRQGAFAGRTPREAYLVKCDRETTTQDDINRGVVNILVGFAPLKPAEFVILKIQQLAGQIQA